MTWTKQQYIERYPDGPNPYSRSDEPCARGQLVDEGAMLRAMDEHDRLMAACLCEWDIDGNTPPAGGCPSHPEDE